MMMRKSLSVLSMLLEALSFTWYSPAFFTFPVIIPVAASNLSPLGSPSALNVIGRSPVHGIRYKKSAPGLAPYTFAPLIRGAGDALGVKIYLEFSCGVS